MRFSASGSGSTEVEGVLRARVMRRMRQEVGRGSVASTITATFVYDEPGEYTPKTKKERVMKLIEENFDEWSVSVVSGDAVVTRVQERSKRARKGKNVHEYVREAMDREYGEEVDHRQVYVQAVLKVVLSDAGLIRYRHVRPREMSTRNTEKHPERSSESQEWVELGREVRQANPDLYASLGGNDEEGNVDPDEFDYGESTSSK